MRITEYILSEDMVVDQSNNKTLPAGSFVKPIDPYWLPQHIKDTSNFKWMNKETQVFCYTALGMVLIPWEKLRAI